jgi:hypothetical protein
MSIFDGLFSDNPNDAAYLALASGLLGGKGSFNSILGNSLAGAQGAYSGAADRGLKNQMTKMQIEEMARKLKAQQQQEADQEAFRQSFIAQGSPQMQAAQAALKASPTGTMSGAQPPAAVDPMQTLLFDAVKSRQIGPLDYAKLMQKDTAPIKLGKDEKLLKPGTYQELASNVQAEKDPEPIRMLKSIYGTDTPAYQQALQMLGAKVTSHPPATNIKIDNKLGEGLAKEVGPMIADSAQRALGAHQQISNADTVIRAVDSNKIYAGPGANVRLKGAQIGQMLGIGGADSAETVSNTRAVIQGLARATVAARSALKGQGQVSDFEGKLLAKAESGEIEDMTPKEIKYIAQKNKEYGTKLIEQHGQLIKKARSNPATAGVADFFDIPGATPALDWNSLGR